MRPSAFAASYSSGASCFTARVTFAPVPIPSASAVTVMFHACASRASSNTFRWASRAASRPTSANVFGGGAATGFRRVDGRALGFVVVFVGLRVVAIVAASIPEL